MTYRQPQFSSNSSGKALALVTARALRSIAIIVGVAWISLALRDGSFTWSRATHFVAMNRTLFTLVFFALWIWEFWFQRAKRRHSAPDNH
jgi:hypothetical protein